MSLPLIKVVEGPSDALRSASEASLFGTSPLFSAASKAADLAPFDEGQLYVFLSFRRSVALDAETRSNWIGGRLYNWCTGSEPDYIPLSGAHLKQVLALRGYAAPEIVKNSGRYKLRVDFVDRALAALKANLAN